MTKREWVNWFTVLAIAGAVMVGIVWIGTSEDYWKAGTPICNQEEK